MFGGLFGFTAQDQLRKRCRRADVMFMAPKLIEKSSQLSPAEPVRSKQEIRLCQQTGLLLLLFLTLQPLEDTPPLTFLNTRS